MSEPLLPDAWRVQLPVFEGPLDLLLHLIKVNQVEITDIPVATICDQFHEYLRLMEELNLDIAQRVRDHLADLLVRSGGAAPLLADRQSLSRLQRRRAQRRQLVLLVNRGARSGNRPAPLVLSVHAARSSRLGR